MKKATQTAMKFGAKGIRVASRGRLGGAEMCRREWYREGRVPLHTLRADIEYGFTEAHTTYGIIGVKAGSSRARSCRPRARQPRAPPAAPHARGNDHVHAVPQANQVPQDAEGPHWRGIAKGGTDVSFGDFGLQVRRAGLDHRAPDRGRSYRDLAPRSSASASSTSASSRTTRSRRSRPRPAWVPVRAASRAGSRSSSPGRVIFEVEGVPEEIAREAFHRAHHKLPIKTQLISREPVAMSKTATTLEQLRDQPDDELRQALAHTRDELFRLHLGQHTNQVDVDRAAPHEAPRHRAHHDDPQRPQARHRDPGPEVGNERRSAPAEEDTKKAQVMSDTTDEPRRRARLAPRDRRHGHVRRRWTRRSS